MIRIFRYSEIFTIEIKSKSRSSKNIHIISKYLNLSKQIAVKLFLTVQVIQM